MTANPTAWSLRTRLLAATIGAVVLVVVVLTVAYQVVLGHAVDADATGLARERAESRAAVLVVEGGRLSPIDEHRLAAGETEPVWTVRPDGLIATGPPAGAAVRAAILAAAAGTPQSVRGDRLAAVPLVIGGRPRGAVVAAVRLAPFVHSRRTALVGSIVLGLLVLAAVALATWLALRAALRPVARMTADAAAWGEGDLDRRFDLGAPRDEITGLAATLDGLLGRVAASLRRERQVTSEISHELRTPLARAMAHADLGLAATGEPAARRAFHGVIRAGGELQHTLDGLLAAGRAGAGDDSCDAVEAGRRALAAAMAGAAPTRVSATVRSTSGPVLVAAGRAVVERALAPILANAIRYADAVVEVAVHRSSGTVEIAVHDDGPGIAAHEVDTVFEPGRRGAAGLRDGAGSGLGLPLARRLARAAAGDVTAEASTDGGRVVLRLPSAGT